MAQWLRPVRGGLLHFAIIVLKHDAPLYICYMAFCRLFDGGSYIFSVEAEEECLSTQNIGTGGGS